MPLEKLSRHRIVQALNRLGHLADQEGLDLELCLYGGAALMLAYGARDATKDLDVIAKPTEVVQRLATSVAHELGLDESWLNDQVRQFVSDLGTFASLEIQELETAARKRLKITRPSAGYLLAMKCLAGRSALPGYAGDIADIDFLIRKMALQSVDDVERQIERFYPHDTLTPRMREILEGIFAQRRHTPP